MSLTFIDPLSENFAYLSPVIYCPSCAQLVFNTLPGTGTPHRSHGARGCHTGSISQQALGDGGGGTPSHPLQAADGPRGQEGAEPLRDLLAPLYSSALVPSFLLLFCQPCKDSQERALATWENLSPSKEAPIREHRPSCRSPFRGRTVIWEELGPEETQETNPGEARQAPIPQREQGATTVLGQHSAEWGSCHTPCWGLPPTRPQAGAHHAHSAPASPRGVEHQPCQQTGATTSTQAEEPQPSSPPSSGELQA